MNEKISKRLLIVNSNDENFTQPVIEILSGFDALGIVFVTQMTTWADIKKNDISKALKFQPDIIFLNIVPGEVEIFCLNLFKSLSMAMKKKVFYQGSSVRLFNSAGAVQFHSDRLNDINKSGSDYTLFLLLVKDKLGLKAKKEIYKKSKNKQVAVFHASKSVFEDTAKYLLDHLAGNYGYIFEFEYLSSPNDENAIRAAQLKNCQADIIFVDSRLLFADWFIAGYNEMAEINQRRIVVFGDDNISERLFARTRLFSNLYVEDDDKLAVIVYVLDNF